MICLIPLLSAILNRMMGGGIIIRNKTILPKLDRRLWLGIMTLLALYLTRDPWQTLAFGFLFALLRFPPTQGLFSAINGNMPTRRDMWYWPTRYLPEISNPAAFAVAYGAARSLVCIPALIALYVAGVKIAPLFMIGFALQGVIYWMGGKIAGKVYGPAAAEMLMGLMVGGMIIL